MKREKTSWSNLADVVVGPCAVCGQEVRYVIPSDRPDPAFLNHSTCDILPLLRVKIKTANPPPLPGQQTYRFKFS